MDIIRTKTRNRILFGLIFGPLLAVVIAWIILSQIGILLKGCVCFMPIFTLVIIVIVKASIIRTVTGISSKTAYWGSLFLLFSVYILVSMFQAIGVIWHGGNSTLYYPLLITISGGAFILFTRPHPTMGLFIIGASITAFLIETNLYIKMAYWLLPPESGRSASPLYSVPLFLLAPFIEIWLALIVIHKKKVIAAVILSDLALLFFIANVYFVKWVFRLWLEDALLHSIYRFPYA